MVKQGRLSIPTDICISGHLIPNSVMVITLKFRDLISIGISPGIGNLPCFTDF